MSTPKKKYSCHRDSIWLIRKVPMMKTSPPPIITQREPKRSLSTPHSRPDTPKLSQLTMEATETVPRSQANSATIGLNMTPKASITPYMIRLSTKPANTITQP